MCDCMWRRGGTIKPGEKDLPPLPSETESVCELVKMREEHLAYLRVAALRHQGGSKR